MARRKRRRYPPDTPPGGATRAQRNYLLTIMRQAGEPSHPDMIPTSAQEVSRLITHYELLLREKHPAR